MSRTKVPGVPARFYTAFDRALSAAKDARVSLALLPERRVEPIEPVTTGGWSRVRTTDGSSAYVEFRVTNLGPQFSMHHVESFLSEGRRGYERVPVVTRSPDLEMSLASAAIDLLDAERTAEHDAEFRAWLSATTS